MSESSGIEVADPFGYSGLDQFIASLEGWFNPRIEAEYGAATARTEPFPWRLYLGVLVFGRYVDRFLDLCVPSLLAPGNLPALPRSMLVIHTSAADADVLRTALTRQGLDKFADIEISLIPPEILDRLTEHEANKYWLLSAVHNADIHTAKCRWCAYHMLMPDHVYSENYFRNVARLAGEGRVAIVQCNVSASLERVTPKVRRLNGVVPAKRLVAMAVANMHQQVTPCVMNGRRGYPLNLGLVWIAEDRVEIFNPHMSIVYLSHAALTKAPVRLFNTVDGQLPFLIPPPIEPYVPTPADDMTYMEVSDREKPLNPIVHSPLAAFCMQFWLFAYCHKDYLRFSDLTTVLPLPKGFRHRIKPMTLVSIHTAQAKLREALRGTRDELAALVPESRRRDPILSRLDAEARLAKDEKPMPPKLIIDGRDLKEWLDETVEHLTDQRDAAIRNLGKVDGALEVMEKVQITYDAAVGEATLPEMPPQLPPAVIEPVRLRAGAKRKKLANRRRARR